MGALFFFICWKNELEHWNTAECWLDHSFVDHSRDVLYAPHVRKWELSVKFWNSDDHLIQLSWCTSPCVFATPIEVIRHSVCIHRNQQRMTSKNHHIWKDHEKTYCYNYPSYTQSKHHRRESIQSRRLGMKPRSREPLSLLLCWYVQH